ncbi:hypothetical protein CsSME_00051027 [Camellia sinensis var. sinensis]
MEITYTKNFYKEKEQSALRAQSSSVRSSKSQAKITEESVPKTVKFQPFIQEEALDVFPSTAEQFFDLLLNDDSNFINEYRSVRKDTNLTFSHDDQFEKFSIFSLGNDSSLNLDNTCIHVELQETGEMIANVLG